MTAFIQQTQTLQNSIRVSLLLRQNPRLQQLNHCANKKIAQKIEKRDSALVAYIFALMIYLSCYIQLVKELRESLKLMQHYICNTEINAQANIKQNSSVMEYKFINKYLTIQNDEVPDI